MRLVHQLLDVVLPEVSVARLVRRHDHLHGLGLADGHQPRWGRGAGGGVSGGVGGRHLGGDAEQVLGHGHPGSCNHAAVTTRGQAENMLEDLTHPNIDRCIGRCYVMKSSESD